MTNRGDLRLSPGRRCKLAGASLESPACWGKGSAATGPKQMDFAILETKPHLVVERVRVPLAMGGNADRHDRVGTKDTLAVTRAINRSCGRPPKQPIKRHMAKVDDPLWFWYGRAAWRRV